MSLSKAGLREVAIKDEDCPAAGIEAARKTTAFNFTKAKRASYDSQQGSLIVKQTLQQHRNMVCDTPLAKSTLFNSTNGSMRRTQTNALANLVQDTQLPKPEVRY